MKYTVIKIAVGVLFVAGYVPCSAHRSASRWSGSTICPRSMS